MSVATMMATLKLNIQDFSSKLDTAAGKLAKFANNAQQDYGKAATTLKSHNLGLKDTARIVQGIVISQAFYSAVNAISGATSALWNFNRELDYAKVTYTALFSSNDLADKFATALQQHAVETIFDYQQLSAVSKKLLAYGIEYKNLMFVMEGLTNLGAMSGDPQAMDRIGLAIGQIKTTGYLTASEMRQLANAYVPIYDIVQEAFGLTGKQMQNIGDLKIPAHDVINAIVDYANAKFGAVGDAATYTITGIENRIVDTLKTVGSAMIEPISTAYKSMLVYIADGLGELRNAFNTGGLGGVFEYLVPDKRVQATIRQFIANVANLLMSLASAATVAANLFGNLAQVFITAFNIVAPVISNVVNVLSAMVNAMLQNSQVAAVLRVALVAAAGAFVLLRVQAAAALVVTAVTKAVTTLSGALITLANIIVKHPIISLLFALGITLTGISVASNKANGSISGLFDRLSDVGGLSSKDILQPVKKDLKETAKIAEDFNDRIDEGAKIADDAKKKVGKAARDTKKALGLLSFDEVFKLPEKADPAGSGSGSKVSVPKIGDYAGFGDIGGLSNSLIPEIPDFSEYIGKLTDGLFGGLGDSIKEKLKSIGIGALIGSTLGAIIGGIIGGAPGAALGAKIGAFAGGVIGWIWDELKGAMSNTFVGFGSGIIGAISKALTKAGAAGLGTIIKNAFAAGGWKGVFAALGGALKTTGLKSIVKGSLLGAAIGLVVDAIAHLLWNTLEEKFQNADAETAKIGQTIGSLLGTIVGAIFGGPVGAIAGSAIGTFAGGFVGLFWEPISKWLINAGQEFASFMNGTNETYNKWAANISATVADWSADVFNALADWCSTTWDRFDAWAAKTIKIYEQWCDDVENAIGSWIANTVIAIATWVSDTWNEIATWCTNAYNAYIEWCNDTDAAIKKWVDNGINAIAMWCFNTWDAIASWCTNVLSSIISWGTNAYNKISTWVSNTVGSIRNWATDTYNAIKTGLSNVKAEIANRLNEVKTNWLAKWEEIKTSISSWWDTIKRSMGTWLDKGVMQPIKDFFNVSTFWNKISSLLTKIKDKFSNWWSGLFDSDVKISGSVTGSGSNAKVSMKGHATGGVFNREHIARFAEGNRAEAIIPLENDRAMQPFVDAVSSGLVSSLAPIVASINTGNSNNLPPLYVGTLIADDRGIKQLYDKFEVIRLQESDRRGTTFA